MPIAFVTGATGFIGSHVALCLLENGFTVCALARPGSRHPDLAAARLEWRTGDIRSPHEVQEAMEGCDVVFHVAADYRLWCRNPREIYETNVGGTRNVLEAARIHGIERVVYTSSVGALGLDPHGAPADETVQVCLEDMVGHYKRSKFLAERCAEEFVRAGLPVIMVHPSTPVGPGDRKPTPTGKIIVDFLNGRMPAYLNTGLNLVHVRDVAEGHRLALEKGIMGEKYILGNRDLTLAEIFGLLEKISGIRAPRILLPYAPILLLARINDRISRAVGVEPLIPLEGVRMARKCMFFNPGKAVRELGLPQTPVETALAEAVSWFRSHGYAP